MKVLKKLVALVLVMSLFFTFGITAASADENNGPRFEKIENSAIEGSLIKKGTIEAPAGTIEHAPNDVVRASIVLDGDSMIEAGYSTEDVLNNSSALKYLSNSKNKQKNMEKKIEKATGKKLKVKQNLTLAANIISAEVVYGDIAAIEAVAGVKEVVLETQYFPCDTAASPQMAIAAGTMTGAVQAWADGYTGAGARIAIIDTGLDIDHQSFDNDAFIAALQDDAKNFKADTKQNNGNSKKDKNNDKGKNFTAYLNNIKLLDEKEIKKALPYLNAYAMAGGDLSAADLVISDKIPFGFNYVDVNTNVRHIYDTQGEHGSHVAGIAAANRYIMIDGEPVEALGAVGVSGNAPDAQVLVMKVFGQGGGAYDSDYMAAIEDAIVLGCDSVNLSLGSGNAGTAASSTYQDIMDRLSMTETVVVMSAGNSGAWADDTYYGGLYSDGANFDTAGSPGSFTNSFTVASVDNLGMFGYSFSVGDNKFGYTETSGYGNEPFTSLGAGNFEYVFLDGYGEAEEFEGIDVEGKVVFCMRGNISFYVKANNAAERGAAATVVYNNQAGSISMNLTGYEYSAPCVSITQAEGALIRSLSVQEDGYLTGTLINDTEAAAMVNDPGYKTVSDFSSWGVPGDLSLKPEIAAPGGSIYSVAGSYNAGGGTDQYELMSGTSMAAPQITGMAAVLKQYIEANGLKVKDLTSRGLAQSLLMSTAEPMLDGYGYYYSVMQQGAGLANVVSAMNAATYVTTGNADGKVKAELGDDPARTGVYSFSFKLTNISGKAVKYNLGADVFAQWSDGDFLYNDTDWLDADVVFTVNGKAVNSVDVKKNGSATVGVTIALTDDCKAYMDYVYPAGTYVEAYVYAEPTNGTSAHSIPVLAYYGSWTDPSMYDVGSYIEFAYGLENRPPYLYDENGLYGNAFTVNFADGSGEYYFGGNLYADNEEYHPEFASMNSENGDSIKSIYYALIRNAAKVVAIVSDAETGEIFLGADLGAQLGAYYYVNGSTWYNTSRKLNLNWAGTDAAGNPLPEGTKVNIDLIAAPEYYVNADGSVDLAALGEGAFFSTALTIDNTAPELMAITNDEYGALGLVAADNLGIAAVYLFGENGRTMLGSMAVDDPEFSGWLAVGMDDDVYLIAVVDYAGNMSTYRVFLNIESTDVVESVTLSEDSIVLIKNNSAALSALVDPINVSDDSVVWSSSDESVAVVNADGVVTAVGVGSCEIIAASALDPTVAAVCTVEVIEINADLNGVVWDENGEVWFSSFNTSDLPNYTKLTAASVKAPVNGLCYGADGTLYATDIDTEEGVSSLYIVDPESFDLTYVGTSEIAYTDIAEAPGCGVLMATYFNYVVIVDPETGDYLGAFNYLPSGELVGIAYVGSQYHPTYGTYLDMYYLMDSDGNLYFDAFINLDGSFYYFNGAEGGMMGSTGITCDTPYFQSLYFNGEYTFASCFNESKNSVELFAVDTEYTGMVASLGCFADGVWPVAALCELDTAAASSAMGGNLAAQEVNADAEMVQPVIQSFSVKK